MSQLQPADATFFDSAPQKFVGEFDIARPASEVWLDLVRDKSLDHCRVLTGAQWTSPRPFGVGTTRTARALGGANVLEERFFAWEEGRRMAFTAERSSMPLFKRFAEDYVVEPDGAETLFTWTVAIEPKDAYRLPVKVLAPAFKAALGQIPSGGRRYFANHA